MGPKLLTFPSECIISRRWSCLSVFSMELLSSAEELLTGAVNSS